METDNLNDNLDLLVSRNSCAGNGFGGGNPEKRKEIFLSRVSRTCNFTNIELVGKYINTKTDTKFYCKECKNFFYVKPRNFYTTRACPFCNSLSRKNIHGENNTIYNSNEYMYHLLLNKEDGKKYGEQSQKKLKWLCPNCNNVTEQSAVNVYRYGFSCKFCGDGISYPNKVFSNLFNQIKEDFIPEKIFDWSKFSDGCHYQYDFYLPNYNIIVEAMGLQHYQDGCFGCSLKSVEENDKQKEMLAVRNFISSYIIIDCRISDISFIKKSILNSELRDFLNLNIVDWNEVFISSQKSVLIQCCNEYDKNELCLPRDLANKFKLSPETISSYLKRGRELGLCSYSKEDCINRRRKNTRKRIDQYSLSGEYIKTFEGIVAAEKELGIKYIADALRNKIKSKGGFIWKYSDK